MKGWPFLVAHLFVAYLVKNSWVELNRERRALKDWDVSDAGEVGKDEINSPSVKVTAQINRSILAPPAKFHGDKKRETIVVLEQFVDESRAMGGKGLFVPMTDFSDRLDSAVEGKIAELHDRTNLFLYVGIAGTMFGVFEFAFRSYDLIISSAAQSDKLIKLGEYLASSMSRAFPVGFFGLLFTFIAQVIATRPEQHLREELSEATRKALDARKAAIRAQADVIQKASRMIAEAVAPLKDLQTTFSESLKPVVELFGERLDRSLSLIQTQFKRLETSSAGLQTLVDEVKKAVGSIADATNSLDFTIKQTPNVINHLLELERKHESSLGEVDALFMQHFEQANQLTSALHKAIGDLSILSERVISEASDGINRIETASTESWTSAAENLRKQLEAELGDLFTAAVGHITKIIATINSALTVMNAMGAASAASISSVGKLAPEIAENYKASLDKVGQDSFKLWGELSEKLFIGSERQYLDYVNKIRDSTLQTSGALKTAANEWDALARSSHTVLKEPVQAAVAEARTDLISHLRLLDTHLADRITQFSNELTELQNLTDQLVSKVGSINEDLNNWAVSAGPLTKDIRIATESIRRQSESQIGIVKRLDTVAEKLTRLANRSGPVHVTSGTTKTIITPPVRPRVWWNPKTWLGTK